MNDYIRRKDVLATFCQIMCLLSRNDGNPCGEPCGEYIALSKIPASDVVERKKGKWVDGKGNHVPWDEQNKGCPLGSAYCSECGEWLTGSDEYPAFGYFCPNCGADMRGEKNERPETLSFLRKKSRDYDGNL